MIRKSINNSRIQIQTNFVSTVPDSDFAGFLRKTHEFIQQYPELLEEIREDLDDHALQKKKLRVQDEIWEKKQQNFLEGLEIDEIQVDVEELELDEGRPRTGPYVVFLYLMTRGYKRGLNTREFKDFAAESRTLECFINRKGEPQPAPKTAWELLDAITNKTRKKIEDKQTEWIMDQGWDDMNMLLQDSTAVPANTEFPHDATIIRKLLERVWRNGTGFEEYGLENFQKGHTLHRLEKIKKAEYKIKTEDHKAKRKKQYRRIYEFAEKAGDHLERQRKEFEKRYEPGRKKPTEQKQINEIREQIKEDVEKLREVITYSKKRVLEGGKTAAKEKVLSVGGDPDAGFITKGEREDVVGYKPQIGRSKKGFIVGFILPRGNASDVSQWKPMIEQWKEKTGKVPEVSINDGGYGDGGTAGDVKEMGVEEVSISGGKGKAIHGEETYESEQYREYRRKRSRVESSIFVLKHVYGMNRSSRRGIESVRAEMKEGVIAHNFFRVLQLERKKEREEKEQKQKDVA